MSAPRRPKRGRTSWLVRVLGLSRSRYPVERRGFIGIQIDGLGYYVLKGALNRRYTPFLRKLVRRRGYRLERLRVGLPATTPASQAAILYGDNHDIPGFRWFAKDEGRLYLTKYAGVCAGLEERLKARSPSGGVLRHGSSYCNMVSGDADQATLTLSRLGAANRAPLGWVDLAVLLLLSLGLLFRIFGLALWEALLELYDHLSAMQNGRPVRDEGVFPLVRVFTNVVFREIATQGCLVDIHRGVPFIYLNYSGYDEVAHHRGPNSVYARLTLRSIDAQVRRIVRAAQRFGVRHYDVVLLSDHGQSTTVPFEHLHGQSLTDLLLEKVAHARLSAVGADHRAKQVGRSLAFTHWLREVALKLPRTAQAVVRTLARWMADRLPDEASGIDWDRAAELLVAPTGSLAHVYFTTTPEPLPIEEVRAREPALLGAILAHPSVAAVAARTRAGGVEILSAHGSLRLDADGSEHLAGAHPLDAYFEGRGLTDEVVRLASMPHAGDLVLFSAKHRGRVVNFQVEMGSHGGLHLDEQSAFLLLPPEVDFDVQRARSIRDVYALFARYHEGEAQRVETIG